MAKNIQGGTTSSSRTIDMFWMIFQHHEWARKLLKDEKRVVHKRIKLSNDYCIMNIGLSVIGDLS